MVVTKYEGKLTRGIETTDICSMFATMAPNTMYHVSVQVTDQENGEPAEDITYDVVRCDATTTKPEVVYFFKDGFTADEKEQTYFVNINGDAYAMFYKGVPYCVPFVYNTPDQIAASLPEEPGKFLRDVITLTTVWMNTEDAMGFEDLAELNQIDQADNVQNTEEVQGGDDYSPDDKEQAE